MTEQAMQLLMLFVASNIATVFFVTRSSYKVVEECRRVMLEREETDRQLYARGPAFPDSDKASNLEVI